jgi:transitional endoplasmic reticulum ATPase
VREMIELPLKHPEVFDRLGIEPPKGVLLHGPPGTGKTLIARAVASESGANFFDIAGPEVMSKFYGESEANLRQIFEQAEKNAPSIIFIDELDSLAPKREEVTGEVERRMVAQLSTLMDGLKARGKVIVIGATNRPNALDPAIRRPGRFDREIEIGVPDRDGRKEILQIHSRGMPLAKDVDLNRFANVTHGFVGADLEALAKEAAMSALRKILPEIKLDEKAIPPEVLEKLQVTKDDFDNGLRMVEPSAMREVLVEVPNVRLEDVGGLEEAKQELKDAVEWPLKHPDAFKRMGIEPPHGILMYGPPGSGKTLLARAVATESEANFIAIKGPELLSKWVGESEKGVRETFRKARMAAPAIVFFDEIDAIVPSRGSGFGDSHVTERVISQLLTELDGLEKLENVVVLAATNRPDLIDSAVLRPGRFDRLVLVQAPDKKARHEIFKIHTKGMPLAKDVDLNALATETEGYVGADIAALCREAAMFVLRRDIKGKEVKMADFTEVIKRIRPSVTKEIEKDYEAFSGRSRKRIGEDATRMHY